MPDWRSDLRAGLRSAADLARLPRSGDPAAAAAFQVRAPASYLALVDWQDPLDPIAAQILPDARELEVAAGELADPIGDAAWSPVPRLTHRYPDRVLLFPTYECAVYCRHCFRKEAVNEEPAVADLEPALAYIAAHEEIREVILTGGDPWMWPDARLAALRARLDAIPHLRLLRVHTRVPVVLPERVTDALLAAHDGRLMVAVVLHANHPRELTPAVAEACARIRRRGFILANQTVLLRGVNDDAETLKLLFQELVYRLGARPYYLHHCDMTRGLSHLRTGLEEGRLLMDALRAGLSGFCVPHYVLDLPGGAGKVPLDRDAVLAQDGADWTLRDRHGRTVHYRESSASTRR